MMMNSTKMQLWALLVIAGRLGFSEAFVATHQSASSQYAHRTITQQQSERLTLASFKTARSHSQLAAAASSQAPALPNPFRKLPWNQRKEQERQARRMKLERAQLHRELGIAEDATYEEIVAATNQLIAAAGSDLKAKIKVEVAKDKILQHRLNERLAGLKAESKEARAMSTYETEGYVILHIFLLSLFASSSFLATDTFGIAKWSWQHRRG